MIDHILADLISAIRRSFDQGLLQRQAVEERFQVDVFLGDLSWETSYSLPGEEQPPRVRADISIDWPTWSQTSYRSWSIGEAPGEWPEVVVEVAMRIQRLAEPPPVEQVATALPPAYPLARAEPLARSSITVEQAHLQEEGSSALAPPRWAVEAIYEGSVRFDEANLEDPGTVQPVVDSLTRWVSSTLVQLADLPLRFLPPDPPDPAETERPQGQDRD